MGLVGLLIGASVGRASSSPAESAFVDWIPVDALNGGEVSTVYGVAVDSLGQPMSRRHLKIRSDVGRIIGVRVGTEGGFSVDVDLQREPVPSTVTLSVQGRRRHRSAPSVLVVPVEDTLHVGNELKLSREVLYADDAKNAYVEGRTSGRVEELLLTATTGRLGEPVSVDEEGRWRAEYSPLSVNHPHVDLVTLVDWSRREPVVERLVIPVHGRVAFPVRAEAGAMVSLAVGERIFGPVEVGASGVVRLPIEVPPGVDSATRIVDRAGIHERTSIDLRVPASPRIAWSPVPEVIGGTVTPVRLWVVRADGRADEEAVLELGATEGRIGGATYLGDGVYQAMYTSPELDEVARDVVISAWSRELPEFVVQRTLHVLPPRIDDAEVLAWVSGRPLRRVSLSSATHRVSPDGRTRVELLVRTVDAQGYPVPEQAVSLTLSGTDGHVTPGVRTDGSGRARAIYESGERIGLARIEARAGGIRTVRGIFQVPPEWENLGRWSEGPQEPAEKRRSSATRPTWLRARAGYRLGAYRFDQAAVEEGPLLQEGVSMWRRAGGRAALAQGAELSLIGELPMLAWLGFDVGLRAVGFSVTSTELSGGRMGDVLWHGRTDLRLGHRFGSRARGLALWGRVGFHLDDWGAFTGSVDAGEVTYETVLVPSWGLGVELGGDLGWMHIGIVVGGDLVHGIRPYAVSQALRVTFDLTSRWSLEVGLDARQRRLRRWRVAEEPVEGTLSDTLTMGTVGIGLAL